MALFLAPLEDDMWSQERLFKTDKGYRENLLITKVTKYRKEPYFNALNSCSEFETIISLVGGSQVNQNEKMYIALIIDLFKLESKGKI